MSDLPLHDVGTAAKNTWWYQDCPKHGKQPHLLVVGGRCEKCQAERLTLVA